MKKYKTIVTSISSKEHQKHIIDKILSKQLSPCIQIIRGVESSYIWENEIITEKENIIFIKTISKNKNLIIKEIKSIHSYDTPEIICYDFDILSNKYENWFLNNIK